MLEDSRQASSKAEDARQRKRKPRDSLLRFDGDAQFYCRRESGYQLERASFTTETRRYGGKHKVFLIVLLSVNWLLPLAQRLEYKHAG
ncbi:MAG: hypothetical protein DMG64_11135 [Acidobacteria bacterium]|nr:MAG: hypothetical protein DMG63_13675 [Acidobacteriota bacterium]PYY02592.1 MAG: hypothetical protein DMG64_11135 [Acidobacteriota bacterium]PYY22436.1 MAG: hypothetical protein DMG62_13295 [Acidobacteriota bacterium]